MIEMCNIVGGV